MKFRFLAGLFVAALLSLQAHAQSGPSPTPTIITCGSGLTCLPSNPINGQGTISATGGGTGTVTAVTAGKCLSGGTITTTGTLTGAAGVDPRTTTSEALTNADQCELVTFNNASPVAASIAQAGSGGNFSATWASTLLNIGAGAVTLTPTTSLINGAANIVIPSGASCGLYSDGANYFANCAQAPPVASTTVDTQWQKRVAGAPTVTLTDTGTISWDASLGNTYKITLGGNRTMAAPTSAEDGATVILYVVQDGTGSRTITWNSVFKWPGGIAPTLSTAAGAEDMISCSEDGTNFNCALVGLAFQ